MKCAVLCNGPSRIKYQPSPEYKLVVGCNIPWTKVDISVILDKQVIDVWNKDRTLIDCKVIYSKQSWEYAKSIDDFFFDMYYMSDIKIDLNHHSAGHNAVEWCIKQGYNDIDIFGCDNYFDNIDASYTRQFIPLNSPNRELRHYETVKGWRIRWKNIKEQNPNVRLNFIK